MNNIFTYPNNPGTYYIDPANIGDGTYGFSQRVSDLITYEYLGWNGTGRSPSEQGWTWQTYTPYLSKYYKYYNSVNNSTNATTWNFWLTPLIEYEFTELTAYNKTISQVETVVDGWNDSVYQQITFGTPHNFIYGEQVTMSSFPAWTGNNGDTAYVKVNSPTEVVLYSDSALTNYYTSSFNPFYKSGMEVRRRGTGVIATWETAHGLTADPTIRLRLSDLFDNPNDTGTLNSTTTNFYYDIVNDYAIKLYLDSAFTTPATLTENYIGRLGESAGLTRTLSNTYTNDTGSDKTFYLTSIRVSDFDTVLATQLASYTDGYCRVTATVNSGTFTPNDLCSKPIIVGAIDYSSEFRFDYSNGSGLANITDGTLQADFILSAGGSVTIHIDFIDPATASFAGGFYIFNQETTGNLARTVVTHDVSEPYYTVSAIRVVSLGNLQYSYLNESGVATAGAKVLPQYWLPGGSINTLETDELVPTLTYTFDGNKRITAAALATGGRFRSDDVRVMSMSALANRYVPPVVYSEDQWDTDDEWATGGYAALKLWPTHVKPANAKITVNQPSSKTYSQNGTKYVKSSGVVRYQIEMDYPPMLYDDFIKFHRVVQAARGQLTPFTLNLTGLNGKRVLFSTESEAMSVNPRPREEYAAGTSVMTFEGFASDQVGAFKAGEHVLFSDGNPGNGNLAVVVNSTDANVFGEARVRFAYPVSAACYPWYNIYKSPTTAVATLDDDQFEYTIDAYGHYTFKVIFALDQYKP